MGSFRLIVCALEVTRTSVTGLVTVAVIVTIADVNWRLVSQNLPSTLCGLLCLAWTAVF